MNKSILQIAEDIGVTRQTVYAKIKSHDLTDKLQPYTIKQGNVTLYSEEGQNLIKQAFKLNQDNEILQTVKDKMTEIQKVNELTTCQKRMKVCQRSWRKLKVKTLP